MSKIYLAGPISGLTLGEATHWRQLAKMVLMPLKTVSPLRGADAQPGRFFNPNGERWTSMKEIFARDHYDVQTCDVMLINFIGAKTVSRGTLMEIAWAYAYRKPMVCAIEKEGNPNWDVFMEQAIPFFASTLDEAFDTVKLLCNYGN